LAKLHPIYLSLAILTSATLACSLSGVRQKVNSVEGTAVAIVTGISEIIHAGGSLIETAQAIQTQKASIIETARAIATQGAPLVATIQAATTHHPGLVQTAKALVKQEVPSGDLPGDIPIFHPDEVDNFFASSQYVFYTCQVEYTQILDFYKIEMPVNGWQYLVDDSQEYAQAAQLSYSKDTRIATVNLSRNPLNDSSVVVINIMKQ
jgi:hypothetical protein